MDLYTIAEIKNGTGLFRGRWTCIYQRPDGLCVTAERSDSPGSALEFIGGGQIEEDGTVTLRWC